MLPLKSPRLFQVQGRNKEQMHISREKKAKELEQERKQVIITDLISELLEKAFNEISNSEEF